MSAFLGPIHYWLYHKILLQEELTRDIALFAQENGYIKEDAYTYADGRPLEEIIDKSNIHGWLHEYIHSAERRYARLVTDLIAAGGTKSVFPLTEPEPPGAATTALVSQVLASHSREARSPRPRCRQGWFLLRLWRRCL